MPRSQELRNRVNHARPVGGAAERVVALGIVGVERDLERRVGLREGQEPVEQAIREERRVRQGERRQHPAHLDQGLGKPREHERLATGDPDVGEAELLRLLDRAEHRLAAEGAPVGDARRRLGQAVDAGEVAVVGRVEPEPIADPALGNGTLELVPHTGGGMSRAVQYWFSIVIVPARTVSSIS